MDKLEKCATNYTPLSPITFLHRAASVYASRTSLIYRSTTFTWKQTFERCCCLASSLRSMNIVKNDVISVLAPNIPALYEMHFAVPMAGAILNTINTRLDPKTVATILKHSEAKIFFVDYQYVNLASEALQILFSISVEPLLSELMVVVIDDIDVPTGTRLGELEYEHFIFSGNPMFRGCLIEDEWDAIALNYTSGTTSAPKGVVYSHRGAYLSTLSLILQWEMKSEPVYLWSLPMFHCNGWTFTWGIAARGGTNVCIRNTNAVEIFQAISDHNVTHMCGAPVIFNIIIEGAGNPNLNHLLSSASSPVEMLVGGAPPPAPLLEKMDKLGFHVTHAYGLTEATGPALVCEWQMKWNGLPHNDQARLKSRQGLIILALADVDVKDLSTMASVPRNGETVGEIVLRGSSIMKGYYKDTEATNKAFKDGWFLTGDVGVIHSDGYLEIKDRSKDMIISGGENISSIELETTLYTHPKILEAAVVAMPHSFYGETPCAFITLKHGQIVTETDIIAYCKANLPRFMTPRKIVFLKELPKTATGKIQKFQLRALAKTYPSSIKNDASKTKVQVPPYGVHDQSEEQVLAVSRL